jgi:hypothetical protein
LTHLRVAEAPKRARYSCHEAGHAVAGVINGDKLELIVADRDAQMTHGQRALYEDWTDDKGGREATFSRKRDLLCECGGKIMPDIDTGTRRKFYPGSPSCEICSEFLVREVAVTLAGCKATRILMGYYNPFESRDDGNYVLALLVKLADEMCRDIRARGMHRAEEWITKERKAALVLAGVLEAKGVLWGDEAERIVSENLTVSPANAISAARPESM